MEKTFVYCCSQISKSVQIQMSPSRSLSSYCGTEGVIRSRCKEKWVTAVNVCQTLYLSICTGTHCFHQCTYLHLPRQTVSFSTSQNSTERTQSECVWVHLAYILHLYIPASAHGSPYSKCHNFIITTGCASHPLLGFACFPAVLCFNVLLV